MEKTFPVIDLAATGENIARLRKDRGMTTVDNLYALSKLLDVPMEEILVPCKPQLNIAKDGQQAEVCCPPLLHFVGIWNDCIPALAVCH